MFLRTAAALSLAASAAAYQPSQRQSVGLWPLPRSVANGIVGPDGARSGTKVWVDSEDFAFQFQSKETPTLTAAAARYTKLIFLHGAPPLCLCLSVSVSLSLRFSASLPLCLSASVSLYLGLSVARSLVSAVTPALAS